MNATRVIVFLAFAVLIGAPFALRPPRASVPVGAERVIIVSPHNETIRYEFGRAFSRWHEREHGSPVEVVWSVPGGTSEIVKILQSQFTAALEDGRAPGGTADLMFGGGSYVFSQLQKEITTGDGENARSTRVLVPLEISDAELMSVYGAQMIGGVPLYDPDHYWFGTALSAFGIVYNRDVLATAGLDEPVYWADLCDRRYRGWIASVNPGQSGSVTTAFQAILDRRGWARGWQILRRMGANARYFSGSALRPPQDVARGDAAAGICIDFYGRFQSQSIRSHGGGDRLGYVDPPGVTTIDPDPIGLLRNGPNAEIARRFIRFCLTDEAQAMWQFHLDDDGEDGWGPERFELRRLPVRQAFYDAHGDRFIDQVNPYDTAEPVKDANGNVRSFIPVLFAAAVIDNHEDLKAAWDAIVTHPAYPIDRPVVTAADVEDATLREMLRRFDAMPEAPGPDGAMRPMDDATYIGDIKAGWRTPALWDVEARPRDQATREFTRFFREQYREIQRLGAGS